MFVEGKLNYLPINPLGKFTEWFPGFMRGDITCLTGTPSSSKSAFSRFLIEHSAIPWAIKNNKNFHLIKFGLEESKTQYEYTLMSYWLYKQWGVEYNIRDFEAVGRAVEEKHIPWINESEDLMLKMMKHINYEDSVYNSFGIWKTVRNFAANRGKFFKDGKEVDVEKGWDEYRPDDPEEFVVVVVDNLSYVSAQENEKDQWWAIWNTVENLRKYAAIKLNYIILFLQHQDSTAENQESRKTFNILPTENGLGVNKSVSKAYLNLIGIANPNKANTAGVDYHIRNWGGHDLKTFENFLRTVNILKGRWGTTNVNDTVFNAGRCGYFDTIPKTGTPEYTAFIENLKNFK
jgi:hypothetical protein